MPMQLIGFIVAIVVLVLLLIFVFLLYKEARNNFHRVEMEKEESNNQFMITIEEKDAEILALKNKKGEIKFDIDAERKKIEEQLRAELSNTANEVNNETIIEKDKVIENYQKLSIELVKDIHELEEAYIDLGGKLSDIYSDYKEYYE